MPADVNDIASSNVFEYQDEVIVERHGTTDDGELSVISFTLKLDDQTRMNPRERIETDHRDAVKLALESADYTRTRTAQCTTEMAETRREMVGF